MLEKLVQSKKSNFIIDLNDAKNYTCWVLKEKNKESVPNPNSSENKNIISYGAVGLYLQKMEKSQQNSTNSNLKYYEIRFNNLITDIFPFERNPQINFMYYNSQNENLFGTNFYENKKGNYEEKKMEALRKSMINDDIPEMILYKYKYDKNLFKELMEDWEDEPKFIYNIIKENKKYKILNEKEIIKCIKSLLSKHKVELFDIPYIINKCQSLYNNIFKEEDVIAILSLYDGIYNQFKLNQRKITKLQNQLVITTNTLNQYDFYFTNFAYINNAKNELDLFLALAYIGYTISIMNFNSKKKFCDNLMDLNINLTSKKLLQSTLEDECDKIVSKFCLSSEAVVHNLQILQTKSPTKLKEPKKDCQLMDICSKKIYELVKRNKKYHPIYLLQKAINFYIISLESNPYIAKLIFKYFLKSASISTYPTEKGKFLLNYSNPSFRVKKMPKQDLSVFINNLKANDDNFSEIYLDIEKCEKEGLIKCDIEIDMASKYIQELIKLLSNAVNGQREEPLEISEKNLDDKNMNMTDSEETEINKMKSDIKKNNLVRKIAIKNMILDKEFTQKYFINYIRKECHNIAERYLIERISNKFYDEVINRKYIRQKIYEGDDNNKYYYSIFFINFNTFCYIAIDKNKRIKYKNILKTQILLNKENELKNEMYNHAPKYIILGINNMGAYKLIDYFQENESIIFSDYLSLLKMPKQYDINFSTDKDYYYAIAYDQFKYTMNPLEFFIENYNFKYEKNLILNLKLHHLQEQINDIPLLNYCLETQMRRSLNLYKFKYEKGKNPIDNYYSFMNGLGPLTSKLIDDYKNRSLTELKNVTGENILKNIYSYIYNDINTMIIEEENNFVHHFQVDEIFKKMINSFHVLKNKSIVNVFVNDIDENNGRVNCVLFYNENVLKCVLPFLNIDEYITDIKAYFKQYKVILCKIKNLQIDRDEIRIGLSNKIKDLEYLENCAEDSEFHNDIKEIKEEDKLEQIEYLKNVANTQKNITDYYLQKLNENENNYFKNVVLEEIKKDFISIEESGKFCFRPSYLGNNNLILTLNFCEDLTLNYNISKEKEDTYILENKEYQSLNDIVKQFVNPLLKNINDFKQNKYFKSPNQIKSIFDKIFTNINNKSPNINFTKLNSYDAINICFVNNSPNYGLLITKNRNNSVKFDYIELSPNGFYFHNKLFDNISLIIEYYLENNEKQSYKDFICENIISDVHSKLECIDLKYKEFNDQMLKQLNWSLPNDNNSDKEKDNDNKFLGKKRNDETDLGFIGWGNDDNNQKKNEIFGGYNNKNNEDNNGPFWSTDNNNKINNTETNNENNINSWENNNSWQNNDNNNHKNTSNNNNDNDFWGANKTNKSNDAWGNNGKINNNNNWNENNNERNKNNNNSSWNNNNQYIHKNHNNFGNGDYKNRNNKNNYRFNNNEQNSKKNKFNNDKKNHFNNNRYNNNNKFNNDNRNKQVSNFSWDTNIKNNNDENEESNYNDNNNDYWTNNKESVENFWVSDSKNEDDNYNNTKSQNELEWSNYSKNSNINNSTNNNNNNDYNSSNNNNWNNASSVISWNNNIHNSWNNNNDNSRNNNNNFFNKNNYNKNNNRVYNLSNDKYYNRSPFNDTNNRNNSSQFHNNRNNRPFNQRNENFRANKKKNLWSKELDKNKVEDDIKDDKNQGPIDFEKINEFGGYNVNKEDNNDNNQKQDSKTNDEFW